jgi:hypothetical protein
MPQQDTSRTERAIVATGTQVVKSQNRHNIAELDDLDGCTIAVLLEFERALR